MTTPSIDIDLDLIMPWSATGKFPDTVDYRRPTWTGSLLLQPGVTDIQVTWDGDAILNLFLEDASLGSLVALDSGKTAGSLSGLKQYFVRAVVMKEVFVGVQGRKITSNDLSKALGLRFMPTVHLAGLTIESAVTRHGELTYISTESMHATQSSEIIWWMYGVSPAKCTATIYPISDGINVITA